MPTKTVNLCKNLNQIKSQDEVIARRDDENLHCYGNEFKEVHGNLKKSIQNWKKICTNNIA